jgi:hypothetical protein
MKKIIFLALTIIALPIMGMDKPNVTVLLALSIDIIRLPQQQPDSTPYSPFDKENCKRLGIDWEDGTNTYFVHKAFLDIAAVQKICWQKDHPQYSPLEPKLTTTYNKALKTVIPFPSSLPTKFVEQLKKEQIITRQLENFNITFRLLNQDSISSNKKAINNPEPYQNWNTDSDASNFSTSEEKLTNSYHTLNKSSSSFKIHMPFRKLLTIGSVVVFIIWFLKTDDSNQYKTQILSFIKGLMPAKSTM